VKLDVALDEFRDLVAAGYQGTKTRKCGDRTAWDAAALGEYANDGALYDATGQIEICDVVCFEQRNASRLRIRLRSPMCTSCSIAAFAVGRATSNIWATDPSASAAPGG